MNAEELRVFGVKAEDVLDRVFRPRNLHVARMFAEGKWRKDRKSAKQANQEISSPRRSPSTAKAGKAGRNQEA